MAWIDHHWQRQGYHRIAGVDEVGRGSLAGPLVAAAVILPLEKRQLITGVKDSKQLTPQQRERLCHPILEQALAWSVVSVPVELIDEAGVQTANVFALSYALTQLDVEPDLALVDGFHVEHYYPCQTIIHGDQLSYSIAAASIVAKVVRDRIMSSYADQRYGFAQHKGYGTALHQQRLRQFGPSRWHRQSFAPVRAAGI